MVEARVEGFGSVDRLVSIPERVLGWLKHQAIAQRLKPKFVSIPERVLGWLKQGYFVISRYNEVSIPERVLGWLKPKST